MHKRVYTYFTLYVNMIMIFKNKWQLTCNVYKDFTPFTQQKSPILA